MADPKSVYRKHLNLCSVHVDYLNQKRFIVCPCWLMLTIINYYANDLMLFNLCRASKFDNNLWRIQWNLMRRVVRGMAKLVLSSGIAHLVWWSKRVLRDRDICSQGPTHDESTSSCRTMRVTAMEQLPLNLPLHISVMFEPTGTKLSLSRWKHGSQFCYNIFALLLEVSVGSRMNPII